MNKVLGAYRTLGVVFLALLVLSAWLTYATFTKKFADYERITLQTSKIGLQLPIRADVKVRGVLVGEVLEARAGNAEGAELTLGLYPDKVDLIPANVTGSIVPKTLFGEKYVSLEIPETGGSGTIRAGAVVDRTEVGTEVEEVLSDLYPLLRAVQPAELNMTLTALATALDGRGEQLGQNIERLDSYLKRLNPQIPALLEDLELTSEVSDIYADILPEVAQILEDTVKTTGTLEEREAALTATLRDIRSFSATARSFLDANAERLDRLGRTSVPVLKALARYSPVIPCLAAGIVKNQGMLAEAFRGHELHIVLETLKDQPRAYTPDDAPFFGTDTGPDCQGLPNTPYSQWNPAPGVPRINDGLSRNTEKGNGRVAPGGSGAGYFGTPDDVAALRTVLAERLGSGTDLNVLLAGPVVAESVAAGTEARAGEDR
ncbi:MCE family protein [Nocardioides sp. zg-536]|uniref:MCE family protein n=1 Tax=Nocardioides faecalis TaxID=2803858 RepID=A0A939BWE5_9ACTN|nr:MCE family protein [Nocardioides faecalis]MBM9460946.1 MCE family protein [Nocardioides faecalis]MBS4751921.1 MCE family protein [Nocardioides faecalis]QVI59230.1 MCE family protein [Nocardioides faecalis]